jgi:hypothetical protein
MSLLCGCTDEKSGQLVRAASKGDISTVHHLLDAGVSIQSTAFEGLTPLNAAAMRGQLEVVKLLIARGASVNGGPDNDDTPLSVAAIYGHTEVAAFLIAHGGELRGTRASREDLLKSIRAEHNEKLYVLVREQLRTEYADLPAK